MGKKLALAGLKFGKLLVIKESHSQNNKVHWLCKCDCGGFSTPSGTDIKNGYIKTCGCSWVESARKNGKLADGTANIKHGLHGIPEYFVWKTMKQRCSNKNNRSYPDYGGRGITVCDRWKDSFENFFKDMGERPSKRHSIDRMDNDKGYEPSNCKWSTDVEQASNRRKRRTNV